MGLPIICIDARHAKAALKMQINKSERKDAAGIARIVQCGWYKEIRVKSLDSLVSRSLLVKTKRDLENQVRGLLKNLGLVIGRTKMNAFVARAAELLAARPQLAAAVDPLLKAREAVESRSEVTAQSGPTLPIGFGPSRAESGPFCSADANRGSEHRCDLIRWGSRLK